MSAHKWDERYNGEQFAYGKEPNLFFKEQLLQYQPGKILMPADGEGRNGVYAAQQGWQVVATDQSIEGQTKALQLAAERGVAITYLVGDQADLSFDAESFDAIGLIYAHFDADKKAAFHKQLDGCLKPGGIVILEAFSKSHLHYIAQDPNVGGPKDEAMLYSTEELRRDFGNYDVLMLVAAVIELSEGQYHNGKGAVVRFVARKR